MRNIEVKNKKLYKMLLEKKEIVDKGRELNKKIEPLQAKMKPMVEELQELEKKVAVLESKMTPLNIKDLETFKKDMGEFEDIVMFQTGKEGIVSYSIVDVIERTKEQFLEAKAKRDKK